jgi:hypothetical protein
LTARFHYQSSIHVSAAGADYPDMGISGVSGGSSPYVSPGAAVAARVVQVMKKEQDVARDVGQALVQLVEEAAPRAVGGRFSVRG